jgi:voltage-gated potassium channel
VVKRNPNRRSRFQERTARAVASRRVFPYLAAMTAVLAGGVGVLIRIIDPKDFHSVGEGIWWAIVTLATVGYGDVVPTTPWGRFLGSIVIVFGVTFLAFLTATVTSLFVSSEQHEAAEQEREQRAASDEKTRALLQEVLDRVEAIEAKLERRGGA